MKKICVSLCLLFIVFFSANAELNLELPKTDFQNLGNQTGHYISAVKEEELGLKILRGLRSRGELIENPELNLWIRSLGNKLASRAPNSLTPYHFAISKKLSVNAFATIGGLVVVNAGLILKSDSESELAAVIAHEIAHISQRHIQRIVAESQNNKFATGAALVIGSLAASQNSQVGAAVLNATLATNAHKRLSYGRSAEAEADRVGLSILANAGFNPKGMPSFLQKLEKFEDSKTADIREFLQSHPLSVKRVADTSFRAKSYGVFKGQEDIRFQYMREKIRAITNSGSAPPHAVSVKIKNYANALKLKKRNLNSTQFKAAKRLKTKNNVSASILMSELYLQQQKPQQAILLLNPLVQIYPGNEAISAPLAQALVMSGNPQKAWGVLRDIKVSEQTSLEIFEIKQEVAKLVGNTSLAYRAVAERNIRTGRYKAANIQLRQAIKFPGANFEEIQEMQQQLIHVDTMLSSKK